MMIFQTFSALPLPLAMLLATSHLALAEEAVTALDKVVLTVNLGRDHAPVQFDIAMLEQMPFKTFETTTIWTEGPQVFTGVPLVDLLADLGVSEGTLIATAQNDYQIDIPVSDAVPGGPILAYLRNGAPMSLRDKGPLWLVYPYDQDPAYQSEMIYARSVWQLDRIEVLP